MASNNMFIMLCEDQMVIDVIQRCYLLYIWANEHVVLSYYNSLHNRLTLTLKPEL